jgi:parallel beta-helix repeat protein
MSSRIFSGILVSLLLVGMLTLAFNTQPVKAHPTTITVPDDYSTIQEAVNHASEGDTVFVRSGTYSETVTINKTIALIGENRETTTVDMGMIIEADKVTVSEFTVRNNHFGDNTHGIWLKGSNCLISNSIMKDCAGFEGIFLDGRDGGVYGNVVVNNSLLNNGDCGILLWSCNDSLIESNVANGNNFFGIFAYASCRNSIENNEASNNNVNGIVIDWYSSENLVINNTVLNNGWGDPEKYYYASGIELLHDCVSNRIVGNNVTGNVAGLFQSYESNDNIIYHNSFVNNGVQVINFVPCENVWDDGYPSGGNYWSDYNGSDSFFGTYQNLTGSDGIGDSPYNIDVNNVDHYPLMSPYEYWSKPILGDVNRDMKVDMSDVETSLAVFGSYPSHPRWNPIADINSDGRIDIGDIIIVLTNFGQHYP